MDGLARPHLCKGRICMENDMTVGNPLKLLWQFTIPVVIGNLFQQVYTMVDTVIVGRYVGVDALAAVGATGSLGFLVIGWVSGVTSGFSVLLSQCFGSGDKKALKHYTAISYYLTAVMTAIMTVLFLLLNRPLLRLIRIPDELMNQTALYIGIIYAGIVATAAYNMLASALRAIGDSKTPLYFLVLSSILNIVLDLLFVRVFPLGVAGAALATVISQGVSALLCAVFIWKRHECLRFGKEDAAFSWNTAGKLLMMGIPMGLQFSITAIGGMTVQSAINKLGKIYIASFAAAGRIRNLLIQIPVSLGVTIATYVGQNFGAQRMDRVKQGVRLGALMALGIGAVLAVGLYFFGGDSVRIFVSEQVEEVVEVSDRYFRLTLWFMPFLSLIFVYRNALQGLGDGIVPMMGGVFELVARVIAVAVLAPGWGFAGICMADPCAWIAALIPLMPVYYWRMRKYKDTAPVSKIQE